MNIAISNIAWEHQNDIAVYEMMNKLGIRGLEIAPTRIFPENPYNKISEAQIWKANLEKKYFLKVPSIQSIWYGRQEKLFGKEEERRTLAEYTVRAIDFASVIGCRNLVFGCPKNRILLEGSDASVAIPFFRKLGEYALSKGTVIGMEANPIIYGTNYVNDTKTALKLVEEVDSKGFLLNLDVGTMIVNGESVKVIERKVHLINHVHISEPGLKPIISRNLHKDLYQRLKEEKYGNFISIEMGKVDSLDVIKNIIQYTKEVFDRE